MSIYSYEAIKIILEIRDRMRDAFRGGGPIWIMARRYFRLGQLAKFFGLYRGIESLDARNPNPISVYFGHGCGSLVWPMYPDRDQIRIFCEAKWVFIAPFCIGNDLFPKYKGSVGLFRFCGIRGRFCIGYDENEIFGTGYADIQIV